MQSPRPALGWLAIAAAGLILSGCAASSGPAVAVLTPAHASAPITRARAVAYAQAVNLRAADLPDMNVSKPEHEGKAPSRPELDAARCYGERDPLVRILNRSSPTFTSGEEEGEEQANEQIHSGVEVLPAPALAAAHNAAQISPRGLECIRRYIPAVFAKSNRRRLRYGPVTVSRLSNPLPGVAGSFGIEISTSVLGIPRQVVPTPPHVYFDVLGFLSGAAEVNLTAVGFPQPVSEESEQRLMAALYARAQAAKL